MVWWSYNITSVSFPTYAAAAAKSLQSCLTLCDPMGAHQAPPSLEFSRQEHWSGLPFPSPMRESEKWKWRHSVISDFERPHGLQPTRLLHPWDSLGKSTGVGFHCLLCLVLWFQLFYTVESKVRSYSLYLPVSILFCHLLF